MKDNLKPILGTLAVVVVIAIAGLPATEAFDNDDDIAAQGAITLPISETANTIESDGDDTDQVAQLARLSVRRSERRIGPRSGLTCDARS